MKIQVRGDLAVALKGGFASKLREGLFDAVIIETTGMADPAPVAQTFFMDQEVSKDRGSPEILTPCSSADRRAFFLELVHPAFRFAERPGQFVADRAWIGSRSSCSKLVDTAAAVELHSRGAGVPQDPSS